MRDNRTQRQVHLDRMERIVADWPTTAAETLPPPEEDGSTTVRS